MPTATTAAIMEDALNASLDTISTLATLALLSLRAQSATASNVPTLMELFASAATPISLFQVTAPLVRLLPHAPMELLSTVSPVLVLMEHTVSVMLVHLAQATAFFAHLQLFALHVLQATSSLLELALLVESTAKLALMPLLARSVKADSHC